MADKVTPANLDTDTTLIKLRARLEMLPSSNPDILDAVTELYIQVRTLITVCEAQQLEIKKLKAFR